MDYGAATIFALFVIALAAGKLFWLLSMQIMGDISEIGQLAKLKRLRGKRPYQPRVSVVVICNQKHRDISAQLDNIYSSNYVNFDVVVATPADTRTHSQARYYRQKHQLGKRLRIVKISANNTPLAPVFRAQSGIITLVLGGSVSLLPTTITSGIQPFRDRTLKLATPAAYPQLDNRLVSVIQGFTNLFAQHFRRAKRHKMPVASCALFVRSVTFRKIAAHTAPTIPSVQSAVSDMTSTGMLRLAQSAVLVSPLPESPQSSFRPRPLLGALLALVDVLAIVLLLQLLGAHQAVFLLQLAALFVFILAAIAVISAKPLGIVSKLNLILSAPFAYIAYLANAVASIGYYAVTPILKMLAR